MAPEKDVERRRLKSTEHVREYDPLQAVRKEAPVFNRSWMRNGESMPPIQRVGFGIISLLTLLGGLWLLSAAAITAEPWNPFSAFFGLAGLLFVLVAFLGFKNVLRFKHKKSP